MANVNVNGIIDRLVTLAVDLQEDPTDENSNYIIQETYDIPTHQFSGYPSIVVIGPVSTSSQFLTTSANQRDYTFRLEIYYLAGSDHASNVTAWENIRLYETRLVEALDASDNLGGFVSILHPAEIEELSQDIPGTGPTLISSVTVVATTVGSV